MAILDRRGNTISATGGPEGAIANPGLAIKAPARVATTGNITLSGLQTLDGVAGAAGDRVLAWLQTDLTQNGIYNMAAGAWTRAVDFQNADQVAQGLLVNVAQGQANGQGLFELTAPAGTITPGTSQIVFTPAAAAAAIEPVFDGGNAPLAPLVLIQAEVAAHMTLKRWTLLADRAGSIAIDVRRGAYGAYGASLPLDAGASIVAGAPPTLANAQFAQTQLAGSGWNVGLNAGDVLNFVISSVTLIQRVTLSLYGTRP